MCDVPSIAVFCSESIECFPGTVSEFFLKFLVTIPMDRIISGVIVHFSEPTGVSLRLFVIWLVTVLWILCCLI